MTEKDTNDRDVTERRGMDMGIIAFAQTENRSRKRKRKPGIRSAATAAAFLATAALVLLIPAKASALQPDTVQVEVFQNGTLLGTYTIREADGWLCKIPDLPKYDATGQPYVYEVKETPVGGYDSSVYTQADTALDDYFFVVSNRIVENLAVEETNDTSDPNDTIEWASNNKTGEEAFVDESSADQAVSDETEDAEGEAEEVEEADAEDAEFAEYAKVKMDEAYEAGVADTTDEADADKERDDMWIDDGPISHGNLPNTGARVFSPEILLIIALCGIFLGASAFVVLRCRKWE